MNELYLGMGDAHYDAFMNQAGKALAAARQFQEKQDAAQNKNASATALPDEMQSIIDKLQDKVEELISLGMHDEAERILKEIEKYSLKV